MKNDIQYFVDTIMNDKTKHELVIKGWCFDRKTHEIPTISTKKNTNIKSVQVENIHRPDVNEKNALSNRNKAGFIIYLTYGQPKGAARVIFSNTAGDERRVSFNLSKKYQFNASKKNVYSKFLIDLKRGLSYLERNGLDATIKKIRMKKSVQSNVFSEWIERNEDKMDSNSQIEEINTFALKPLISIIMPVYNVDNKWLEKCIDSVRKQNYPYWELCIADDCSTKRNVRPLLNMYSHKDQRIKVVFREENGHICKATNTALSIANGEYIGLLDNDDELAPNALYEVVKIINNNPALDLIYSDEDKIDKFGKRMDPTFKPDWSPDLLMGTNYICHFGVYRKSIVDKIGGFRPGYEGAQDYDLVLRFTEQTQNVGHIPKLLYHWRMLESSTAVNQDSKGYAFEAGRLALEDSLKRRKIRGSVSNAAGLGLYDVHYDIMEEEMVSIIIPTRDGFDDLKKCVESIYEKTVYPNFEIIIADNGSKDENVLALLEKYKKEHDLFHVQKIDIPFNYAKINNLASKKASGKYILFLNNDTEVISPDWINNMVSFAQFDRIGAVGAKLLYPDNTIQHAGVVMGLGGAAGHCHHTFPNGDFGYFGRLAINVNYSAVTAACMMVKKSDFETIGGFNEELQVAFNDVDLCLRLRKLGKYNVWLHAVELYHFESKSRGYENSPIKQVRFAQETEYMFEHWGDVIKNDPFYNPNLTLEKGDYSLR